MIFLFDNGHGINTKGKRSPDGRLLEYQYARRVVAEVVKRLRNAGHDARTIVPENDDIPLTERARRVNAICDTVGKNKVLLVSVHCNAAGLKQKNDRPAVTSYQDEKWGANFDPFWGANFVQTRHIHGISAVVRPLLQLPEHMPADNRKFALYIS